MADSFSKKEAIKKRTQKKKEKTKKKEDRKTHNNKGKGLDSMIAYVDENGFVTSTPPQIKPTADTGSQTAKFYSRKNGTS